MSNATTHIKTEKQLVPALRFKEFDNNWKTSKFGALNEVLDSLHQTPKEYVDEGFAMIRVTDVNDWDLNIEECLRVTEEVFIEFTKRHTPTKDDIIMSRVGTCGAAIKLDSNDPVCLGQNTVLLIPNIEKSFVFAFMKSRFFQNQVDRMVVGSTQKTLSLRDLKKFNFSIPAVPEQQKIASFLSAVDEKIQQLTKKKALLEEYKKGVMQQLFSGQLRFKDENGNPYPDWEEKRLGDVCEVNPKNGELPSSFVYIDLESVEKGQLIKENRIDLIDAPSRAQRNLAADDILYQTVRPYQKNNLFFNKMGEYVASTGYAQLRAKESAMYIFQLIHHDGFVNKVLVRSTGTSYPAINSTDLVKINVSIPSMEEQQKIAIYLSRIDTKIEAVNNQITQTQTFKKGLLQQMFV